jgi:hypothetical protein
MAYTAKTWKLEGQAGAIPISPDNLNDIENAMQSVHTSVSTLEATVTNIQTSVSNHETRLDKLDSINNKLDAITNTTTTTDNTDNTETTTTTTTDNIEITTTTTTNIAPIIIQEKDTVYECRYECDDIRSREEQICCMMKGKPQHLYPLLAMRF